MANSTLGVPPDFLSIAGDPVRWALMRELSSSDRKVEDLVEAVGKPQNLVSYHLGKLRAASVVSVRRSSHDRRDMYYRLDLPRCQELLSLAANLLHPALQVEPPLANSASAAGVASVNVLFLCTANSARSQMAEGLLRASAGGNVTVASAGTEPATVHPNAVRAMKKRGIDIAGQTSKHLDVLRDTEFDVVVTVCDHVKEVCPDYPGARRAIHWSIPDPVTEGEDAGQLVAFERVADEIAVRIAYLIPTLASRP